VAAQRARGVAGRPRLRARCGAGLLVRSFARLTSVDAGFDTTNVVTMGFLLQMERDTDGERLTSYV
jgi:hypothetical protein